MALHVKKFMDGRKTPREVWSENIGFRCLRCGRLPNVVVRSYIARDDLFRRGMPAALPALMRRYDGNLPTVPLIDGKAYVLIGEAAACHDHQRDLEVDCARAPSYYVAVFDRGPDDIKPMVSVA